jgi:hypothetical protein
LLLISRKSQFFKIGFGLMQVSAGVEAEDGASEEENVEDELHWERLGGEIIRLTLQPNDYGFGISLAGRQQI